MADFNDHTGFVQIFDGTLATAGTAIRMCGRLFRNLWLKSL
jgi:hypothetical protein